MGLLYYLDLIALNLLDGRPGYVFHLIIQPVALSYKPDSQQSVQHPMASLYPFHPP